MIHKTNYKLYRLFYYLINTDIDMDKIVSSSSQTEETSTMLSYQKPCIEIIEIDLEGVIAASNFSVNRLEEGGPAW